MFAKGAQLAITDADRQLLYGLFAGLFRADNDCAASASTAPPAATIGQRFLATDMHLDTLIDAYHQTMVEQIEAQGELAGGLVDAGKLLGKALAPYQTVVSVQQATQRLLDRQEAELREFVHAVHGDIGQRFAALLRALRQRPTDVSDQIREVLDKLEAQVRSMEQRLRDLCRGLRPIMLDDLGLVPALTSLANQVGSVSGIDVAVVALAQPVLSERARVALYRAVQEALDNAKRHSGAEAVRIVVREVGGQITCLIRDNGRGFDVDAVTRSDAFGLLAMRVRLAAVGGSVDVSSTLGQGTCITLVVPLEEAL